jgi:MerR family transcriptional regulator/heat shock protein HspR
MAVAAELSGLHPQTLRLYERRGLIEPARTRGGTRRYSPADIDRLARIEALTRAGVNLEGVRRSLELESENADLRRRIEQIHRDAVAAVRRVQALYRAALAPARPLPGPFIPDMCTNRRDGAAAGRGAVLDAVSRLQARAP